MVLKQVTTRKVHWCKSCGEEIPPKSLAWFYYRTKTTSKWMWFHNFCFMSLVNDIIDRFGEVFFGDYQKPKPTEFKKKFEKKEGN